MRASPPKPGGSRPSGNRRQRRGGGTPSTPRPGQSSPTGSGASPESAEVLPRLLKLAGAIVAPTTLLTGLLFYFGRLHITGFFRYLRVNFTTLDLTVNDYLIRSADGLFRPLAAVTVFGLLALAVNRVLVERLGPKVRRRVLGVAVPIAALFGVLCLMVAVADAAQTGPLLAAYPEAGGLGLSAGVLLLAYVVHLSRSSRRPRALGGARVAETTVLAEWGLAFLLFSIGLFWAVGSYAIAVGTGRAQQLVADLPAAADAVLYSEQSLRLAVAGVTEVRCLDPEAAYRFRYDGLKLVLQSGDQYLLLPAGWTRENGTAVLVPRSESVRGVFAPPGQHRHPVC
ncbi:hypothetical protein [Geodermatophilus sp. SYSU D00698]